MGQHRAQHIKPSKGARARKRKRAAAKTIPPPVPLIAADVKIGLNSVTRHLEVSIARQASLDMLPSKDDHRHLASIFLPKHREDIIFAHLPMMCAVASTKVATSATRLVLLTPNAERRLAEVLGLPRVGAVGILEGGQGDALLDFVKMHVQPVEVPWIREAKAAQYLNLKLEVFETTQKVKAAPDSVTGEKPKD